MSNRDDLPPNPAEDERHEIYKQALIEYLTTKAGREERKDIVKEAIGEWLDDKFKQLGKWTLGGLTAAAVAAIGYLVLWLNGWHK